MARPTSEEAGAQLEQARAGLLFPLPSVPGAAPVGLQRALRPSGSSSSGGATTRVFTQ